MKQPFRHRAAFAIGTRALPLILLTAAAGCSDRSGGGSPSISAAFVEEWSQVAVDASGLDHVPTNQIQPHTFGHQAGPCRASRAMAIVHVSMFEALNSLRGDYDSLVGLPAFGDDANARAAVAQAAHDALVALFPSQAYIFDDHLEDTLATINDGVLEDNGIVVGQAAAAAVLANRATDGASHPELLVNSQYICEDDAGYWRQDPVSQHPLALGAQWGTLVAPWRLAAADQFQCPPPPTMDSFEYAIAYAEVLALGGDGVTTPTVRSDEQTFIGVYWAYDGTPSLCAPPRLYNQIAYQIAQQQGTTDGYEFARLLALLNLSMSDAGIASWESKWHHEFWRPITGIREADAGTGPVGGSQLGDQNPLTAGVADWTPLGAPASNTVGPNFTPPFPAYPSGHATFGGALFQTLRRYYGTDDIAFTFVSDEYNGVTLDNEGIVRPYIPRTFVDFSQAEEENGQSRMYLGIHWAFDKTGGITQGRQVANWVYNTTYVD
jgi:hypothetical protein